MIGIKCDRCAPLHFGYDSGAGCHSCNCSVLGSQNSTCDLVSGRCYCKNGVDVTDRKCATCQNGFYNLSSAGCQGNYGLDIFDVYVINY